MSRVGKQQLTIPAKVDCQHTDGQLTVRGPMGTITKSFTDRITIKLAGGQITLTPRSSSVDDNALWGTYGALINNMLIGAAQGYSKKLLIEGVGYKAAVSGQKLVFNLGWSHPFELAIPAGLKVTVEKNVISISGADKELVGQFAANIRDLKRPEPYKGKGIRYEGEVVRRKAGKKVTSTA